MINFIFYCILWTLAIWGLIDIVKNVKKNIKNRIAELEDIFVVVAVKNKEKQVEGIIRTEIINNIKNNNLSFKKIYITDLESSDNTKVILEKLSKDNEIIENIDLGECIRLFESY